MCSSPFACELFARMQAPASQILQSQMWSTETLDAGLLTVNFQGCKTEDEARHIKEIEEWVLKTNISYIEHYISMAL